MSEFFVFPVFETAEAFEAFWSSVATDIELEVVYG